MPYAEISPYDVKNVYRNVEEINRAIKRNTFDIAKTQHMNWNDKNVFWLCYADDKQPVSHTLQQKLNEDLDRVLEEKIDETELHI